MFLTLLVTLVVASLFGTPYVDALFELAIAVVVLGVAFALVDQIPMSPPFKLLLRVIAVIIALLLLWHIVVALHFF